MPTLLIKHNKRIVKSFRKSDPANIRIQFLILTYILSNHCYLLLSNVSIPFFLIANPTEIFNSKNTFCFRCVIFKRGSEHSFMVELGFPFCQKHNFFILVKIKFYLAATLHNLLFKVFIFRGSITKI